MDEHTLSRLRQCLTLAMALTLMVLGGCSSTVNGAVGLDRAEGLERFTIDELRFVEWGWDVARTAEHIHGHGSFFASGELLERHSLGVVRVESRQPVGPSKWSSELGSGIIMASDTAVLLLTAQHVLGPARAGATLYFTARDGERVECTLPDPGGAPRDLAVVRVTDADDAFVGGSPGSAFARNSRRARRGEPVVIVGYPSGSTGISGDGQVASPPPHGGAPLDPVAVLGRVARLAPLTVEFTAGFVPPGGMSGSPVLAADGALLGVLSSLVREGQDGRYEYSALCEQLIEQDLRLPQ